MILFYLEYQYLTVIYNHQSQYRKICMLNCNRFSLTKIAWCPQYGPSPWIVSKIECIFKLLPSPFSNGNFALVPNISYFDLRPVEPNPASPLELLICN